MFCPGYGSSIFKLRRILERIQNLTHELRLNDNVESWPIEIMKDSLWLGKKRKAHVSKH